MSTFFEKLKKGMETEELSEKEIAEEPASKKATALPSEAPSVSEERRGAGKEEKKPEKKREKKPKKEKITEEPSFAKAPKGKEKEKKFEIEVKKEKEKIKESSFAVEIKEKKWFQLEGQLTVDVYQTEKELVIQSAIAGVDSSDLDISIEDDSLIIKGKRERPAEKEERNFFYQECYWGLFSRKIILPTEVDVSRVEATMKKGILTIRIPKIERKTERKITIDKT